MVKNIVAKSKIMYNNKYTIVIVKSFKTIAYYRK